MPTMPSGIFSSPAVNDNDKKLEEAIVARARIVYGVTNPEIVIVHDKDESEEDFYIVLIDKDKYLTGGKGFVLDYEGFIWYEGNLLNHTEALAVIYRNMACNSGSVVYRDIKRIQKRAAKKQAEGTTDDSDSERSKRPYNRN